MCRHDQLSLPARPEAAASARRFVVDTCRRWDLDAVSYEASLLVSELVTNSLLHARTPAILTLSVVHGVLEAAVVDGDERVPVLRPERRDLLADLDRLQHLADHPEAPDADPRHRDLHVGDAGAVTAGRGLAIVDALANEWGTSHHTEGKAVWFTVGTPDEWAWRPHCVCEVSASRRTPSGRPVKHLSGPWDRAAG